MYRPRFLPALIGLLVGFGLPSVPQTHLQTLTRPSGAHRSYALPRGGRRQPQKRQGKTCHHGKAARQRRRVVRLRRA